MGTGDRTKDRQADVDSGTAGGIAADRARGREVRRAGDFGGDGCGYCAGREYHKL